MDEERLTFLKALTDDIQWALDSLATTNTATARRNFLRTLISAAEGISSTYRTHIASFARHFEAITPLMELALAEVTYSITEQGKVLEQARHIPLPAMIRLTTRLAQSICPEIAVDFGSAGWRAFKDAIRSRHRITHPKKIDDLLLSHEEIEAAKLGFFWFANMSMAVMEEVNEAMRTDVKVAKDVIARMAAGDPDTIALYERAHRELDI